MSQQQDDEQALSPSVFGYSGGTHSTTAATAQPDRRVVTGDQAAAERPNDLEAHVSTPRLAQVAASANKSSGQVPEGAQALTADRVVRRHRQPPQRGWRRALHKLTGGKVSPAEDPRLLDERELVARVTARVSGRARFVVVLTRKGGVGKTTTTITLGQTLASLRPDRIVALDGNPDRGTLVERVTRQTSATIRDVVASASAVDTFGSMSALVSRDSSRLDVVASDTDPAVSEAVDEDDYKVVADLLGRHYAMVLTDSGTGMVHSVMRGSLNLADSIVLVAGTSWDEARLASETLEWLEAHQYGALARDAVVVINSGGSPSKDVDLAEIERHFLTRCRAVVRVPYDPHLAEGAAVELDRLRPVTRHAVLQLAAHVVDGVRDPQL